MIGIMYYLLFFLTSFASGEYTYYNRKHTHLTSEFYFYENRTVTGKAIQSTETLDSFGGCLKACRGNSECGLMTVLKTDNYVCNIYAGTKRPGPNQFIDYTAPDADTKMWLVTKEKISCSGYCSELKYLDLCGKCRCMDGCYDDILPYHCDCTEIKEKKEDCDGYREAGYTKTGVYKILPGDGQSEEITVFCEMTENEGWIVIFKRLHWDTGTQLNKQQALYEAGFGKSHDNVMWLGLNNMHRLTTNKNMTLKVDLAEKNERRQTVTYERFQVGSKSEDYRLKTEGYDPRGTSIRAMFEQSIWHLKLWPYEPRFWVSSATPHTPTYSANHIYLGTTKTLAYIIMSIRAQTSPSATQPTSESTTQPTSESTTQPISESTTQPISESTTQPISESTTQPISESTSQPISESTTQPISDSTSQPISESTTQPISESTTQPISESTTQPTLESTTQPISESTTQPISESTTQPTLESTTQPISESTTRPISESTTQPISESTTQPTSESNTQYKTEIPTNL